MNPILPFIFVYYGIFLSLSIFILMFKNLWGGKWLDIHDLLLVLIALFISASLSLLYAFHPVVSLLNFMLDVSILYILKLVFKNYHYTGINFYMANVLMTVVGLVWGAFFIPFLHVSLLTKTLLLLATPLIIVTLPADFFQMFEIYDILCKKIWNRPKDHFPVRFKKNHPMVSLHVPTHAEPPEIVIETLNKLAQLDYKNYEVLVVDNNTQNSALWLPVQKHCKKLGKKFRFFHIDNIAGAKAGALNFALTRANPRASLISIIDADYHTDPKFLKALIGHFDNPNVGFVQTPHDYRGWEKNLFLTMCYWEYKIFFHSTMIALNERGAGITVGTMCIVKKEALELAGGWAEWCVTEDSELAIRIHDLGYSSVYVDKTYGRGLIPDTFFGYKKQRYRWTAGPVQEFKYHIKHFLGLTRKPSSFTKLQRIHHTNHGLDNVILGLSIPLSIISMGVILSLVAHHEIVKVPFELWLAATVLLGANFTLDWLTYKVTIKPDFKGLFGKTLASKALKHTVTYASFKTLFTGNATWNRTNKFESKHSYSSALQSTKEELIIGLFLLAFTFLAFSLLPYTGLALMFLIGIFYTSTSYLSAPLISLINVWSFRKKTKSEKKTYYLDVENFHIPYISILGHPQVA